VSQFGQLGKGPGHFDYDPVDIWIQEDGSVWVVSAKLNRLLKYSREGQLLYHWGTYGKTDGTWPGGLARPHQLDRDQDGNVYIIERDAHRIVKLSPKLDKFLLQLGTTNERGNDATHFDLPSGIAVLKNGNIVVTDGYGNNRVVLFNKSGKFMRQVGKGAGGPQDKGTGPGEWVLPHKLAVDAHETLYVIDRENHRVQVLDKNLRYLREIKNEGWNPWDIGISCKGNDGFAFIADHTLERIHKIQTRDGKILATWGKQGRGPDEFDWVHGVVVDSRGAVYAADTYGQRLQKFASVATRSNPGATTRR
jgi:DNA-binding beta-propeller fold protein YncE